MLFFVKILAGKKHVLISWVSSVRTTADSSIYMFEQMRGEFLVSKYELIEAAHAVSMQLVHMHMRVGHASGKNIIQSRST
jgi:hypothetical protein